MYTAIQDLLQIRANLLCDGQIKELAELFHLPFVTYHDDIPTYIEDRAQAIDALSKIAELMASRGAIRLQVEVSSVELPKNNRFRVWSRYSEINARNEVLSTTDVLQYFAGSPKGPLIQMIESKGCPLAAIWKPENSTTP